MGLQKLQHPAVAIHAVQRKRAPKLLSDVTISNASQTEITSMVNTAVTN